MVLVHFIFLLIILNFTKYLLGDFPSFIIILPAIILKSRGTRRPDVASTLFLTFPCYDYRHAGANRTSPPLLRGDVTAGCVLLARGSPPQT